VACEFGNKRDNFEEEEKLDAWIGRWVSKEIYVFVTRVSGPIDSSTTICTPNEKFEIRKKRRRNLSYFPLHGNYIVSLVMEYALCFMILGDCGSMIPIWG